VVPSGIRVVTPVELGAPHLNDVREPLEKDQFDLLVQFCDPVLKVRVAFQVQPIDLRRGFGGSRQTANTQTYGSLDLVQQLCERLGGI